MSVLSRILLRKFNISSVRFSSNISYKHHVGKDPLKYISYGALVQQAAEKFRDVTAINSRKQDKLLSYGDLLEEADKLAAGLRMIGLEKGDRVGLILPNQYEWDIVMTACARAGLILVALNPFYQAPEVEYCINKVRIKAIFCGDKFKNQNYPELMSLVAPEILASEPGKLKSKRVPSLSTVIFMTNANSKGSYSYDEVIHMADDATIRNIKQNQNCIQADDPCNIQFTSGTTGKPKAAVVSHFNCVNNAFEIAKRTELNTKHRTVCVQVPLFHAFGTTITLMSAKHFGTTLVLPGPSFNANESLDALKYDRCNVVYGTPTMYVDLIAAQTERQEDVCLDIALCGGAPCSPELFKKMLNVLGVKTVKSIYGLTETTGSSYHSLPGEPKDKSVATVGHLQDHLEAKVVDGDGKVVPLGTPGELLIRGYSVMLGYWEDEEQTRKSILPDRWFKTGDQFVMEPDGYGRIAGRIKDMINRGGENIFPKEIEDLLNTHPNVLEAYVIPLSHDRLGEEVCACVRLQDKGAFSLEDMQNYCRGKIAKFKVPSQLRILKNFPKTTSGKIQKFILRQQIEDVVTK